MVFQLKEHIKEIEKKFCGLDRASVRGLPQHLVLNMARGGAIVAASRMTRFRSSNFLLFLTINIGFVSRAGPGERTVGICRICGRSVQLYWAAGSAELGTSSATDGAVSIPLRTTAAAVRSAAGL